MQVHAIQVSFANGKLSDDLFQRAAAAVDKESQERIRKFLRREDAWRCLIGRILPRYLLQQCGASKMDVAIGHTGYGKPYVARPLLTPAVGFNVSHDNGIVAMVSDVGERDAMQKMGIDVMKRELPRGSTVRAFINSISDQLSPYERRALLAETDAQSALTHLFRIWTMKEAYTKALGSGLGFDFSRIEYNVAQRTLSTDGKVVDGWEFFEFEVYIPGDNSKADCYHGMVARWIGGSGMRIVDKHQDPHWLTERDADDLVQQFLAGK